MTWNHRLVRRVIHTPDPGIGVDPEVLFAIHEVYYDDNGKPENITAEPIAAAGETVEEVMTDLHRMLRACEKPVLEYDDFPKGE